MVVVAVSCHIGNKRFRIGFFEVSGTEIVLSFVYDKIEPSQGKTQLVFVIYLIRLSCCTRGVPIRDGRKRIERSFFVRYHFPLKIFRCQG